MNQVRTLVVDRNCMAFGEGVWEGKDCVDDLHSQDTQMNGGLPKFVKTPEITLTARKLVT